MRGDRLKKLRESRRMTHAELAELLGLGVRQISRYESGVNDPTGDVLIKIAEVFNVSTDYLLGIVDDPTPHLRVDNLTEQERAVVAAMRRGDTTAAIKTIVADV